MMPLLVVIGISVVVAFLLSRGVAYFIMRRDSKENKVAFDKLDVFILTGFLPILFAFGLFLVLYQSIVEDVRTSDAILHEGKIVRVFTEREILWNWDIPKDAKIVNYFKEVKPDPIKMSVSPITANPKVRNLHYNFSLVLIPNLETYRSYHKHVVSQGLNAESYAKKFCYDFNEANSKELAEFFNPLDKSQQKRFNDLIVLSFDQYLETAGLRRNSNVSFNIP